ncbi:hypothetical protein MJO28_014386 [Puccinia striiformis f. sp. tritici]|uniref:Carboxylic ester hydrolase n=4 Tax=Puccinia striiformis TaxID=27350 RepID=A0A0L0W3F3_9BASI|nr:hypothetical protein Pst134EA_026838 [Puccinia striiformis f. sp. tritici]KAI9626532.1 hypothetical protein KEM48_010360 [Puccinia striiformis f. sp. tritici PST-130]KNF06078.1 hypothetical protein PSTG_00590 [Puccinia striiformis f. sp. tritici PST-78]POW14616.1 hypothetical protein PSTT_02842 [Puccinia striiformis]KAH9443051.1 hypothetical protein Pst134EB_027405 [Puccinia striiformis f. sp. tritici]KAH9450128.1 hypothetical protein Pst134EA_026838 [Puccinia striiformis f. sp. tritici]
MFKHLFKASLLIASVVLAVSLELFSVPKVELDYGSFIGKLEPILQLERFYGIPFAEPPVGELRFANPIKPTKTYFNRDATKLPPACPQQTFGGNTSSEPYHSLLNGAHLNPLAYIKAFGPGQEDCLTLDITRPAGTTNSSRLPVMYFIFPGGFNYGVSWQLTPKFLVKKSMDMGMPVIHVTANHRLNAFGFLGGKEVGEAGVGNLGLKDQRLTMEWIKTHISQFGGDPDKVTIYGESSGAISVSHHLLAFKGQHNNLFRAAICHSGTAIPIGKLSDGAGQHAFDHIAQFVDCGDASDKLACLRKAPYKKLLKAVEFFPGSFSFGAFPLTFAPVVDGDFVTESMQTALKAGEFAKVPVITGDTLDEGTIFTLGTLPLRTEDDLRAFITKKFQRPTPELIAKILELWPSDPRAGSPFASGDLYALTPVYKQCSAILGDIGFQGLRRLFLRSTASSMPTWSYIDQAMRYDPIIGAFHASDLPALFGFIPGGQQKEYQTRWIAFANNLNPNHPGLSEWPTYDKGGQNLIIDQHGADGVKPDDFRKEAIEFYLSNIDALTFISQ